MTNRKKPSPPLLSWDIFIEGYHEMIAKARDVQQLKRMSKKQGWKQQWDFNDLMIKQGRSVAITDLSFKIIFASSSLPRQVIGKLPGILQGKDTDERINAHTIFDKNDNPLFFIAFIKKWYDDTLFGGNKQPVNID